MGAVLRVREGARAAPHARCAHKVFRLPMQQVNEFLGGTVKLLLRAFTLVAAWSSDECGGCTAVSC